MSYTTKYVESLLNKCKTLTQIHQLHAHLLVTSLFKLPIPRSKFLDFISISINLPYAISIFNQIPNPQTNDHNSIIRGHAQSQNPTNSLLFFISISRTSPSSPPDALTFSFLLKSCSRSLSFPLSLHSLIIKSGCSSDILLQTTLLDVYSKCGFLNDACKVFDEMCQRDIASYNALVSGFAQGNRPYDALKVFDRMRNGEGGFYPNEVTVLGALSACSQLGAIKEGERVYEYVRVCGFDVRNVIVCNAVIDMYAKCGLVEKAVGVFEGMRCFKSVVTWNTMIMGYAMDGDGRGAIRIFERMLEEGSGVEPDEVSYLAALCGCNHAGMVDEGVRLFELMGEKGVRKNVKHYGSVVDLLGRAGRLDEAFRVIESMPFYPDAVLWQTLLGACKTYGNVEMAEKASRRLVEMGSSTCGDFVLLSNVYAARERWKDVGRVRDAMKSRDVRKVPGFSYSEMNGVIFKFFNGDKSHPKWREIYRKLEEISFRIREFGYEPETNYVLHDIGHEEKENALSYHSEKLAMAFGLISGDGKSPININKNLRICGDCHVVIKLVSKLYDREIIVRDRTRFHRFKDGSCSCKDYW